MINNIKIPETTKYRIVPLSNACFPSPKLNRQIALNTPIINPANPVPATKYTTY